MIWAPLAADSRILLTARSTVSAGLAATASWMIPTLNGSLFILEN